MILLTFFSHFNVFYQWENILFFSFDLAKDVYQKLKSSVFILSNILLKSNMVHWSDFKLIFNLIFFTIFIYFALDSILLLLGIIVNYFKILLKKDTYFFISFWLIFWGIIILLQIIINSIMWFLKTRIFFYKFWKSAKFLLDLQIKLPLVITYFTGSYHIIIQFLPFLL